VQVAAHGGVHLPELRGVVEVGLVVDDERLLAAVLGRGTGRRRRDFAAVREQDAGQARVGAVGAERGERRRVVGEVVVDRVVDVAGLAFLGRHDADVRHRDGSAHGLAGAVRVDLPEELVGLAALGVAVEAAGAERLEHGDLGREP
jgi:hypothetical protein